MELPLSSRHRFDCYWGYVVFRFPDRRPSYETACLKDHEVRAYMLVSANALPMCAVAGPPEAKTTTNNDQPVDELGGDGSELWTPRKSADRVATHARRRRASGLVRVSVWVPNQQAQEVQRIAWQMRVQANTTLPDDYRPEHPEIQIPTVTLERGEPPTVLISVLANEVWLHKLLTANGGEWKGRTKRWLIRQDVALALGLGPRMDGSSGSAHAEDETPTVIERRPRLPDLP
jgi:hypothetical protein